MGFLLACNFATPFYLGRKPKARVATLGATFVAWHTEYYKGKGGDFPQVRAMMSFLSPCMPMVPPCTKNAPTTH